MVDWERRVNTYLKVFSQYLTGIVLGYKIPTCSVPGRDK
jgi:hypothetical protein